MRSFDHTTGCSRITSLAACVCLCMAALPAQSAEVRQDDDYIAIVIEAEDFDDKDDRWVLTQPDTPTQSDDPDPNHSASAVGQSYLELLPDLRVTHDDVFPQAPDPLAFWGEGIVAPRANYTVNFPEAGRYHIHVRAFSTGTEDNGLHLGLNSQFPESAKRLQLCSAGQGWTWSSRQRYSGGAGACGTRFTVWLDVEEPGIQTVHVAPREDGFELDRFMLIKDLSGGTRNCEPEGADAIDCDNGAIPAADGDVNLDVDVVVSADETLLGESVTLEVAVRNEDNFDTATDVELTIGEIREADWSVESADERCEVVDQELVCAIGDIDPSNPEEAEELVIELLPLTPGLTEFTLAASSEELDTDPTRAVQMTRIDVLDMRTQLTVEGQALVEFFLDETATVTFSITNTGEHDGVDLAFDIDLSDRLVPLSAPENCTVGQTLQCELEVLAVGSSLDVTVEVRAIKVGAVLAQASIVASNADVASASSVLFVLSPPVVEDPVVEEPAEEDSSVDQNGQNNGDSESEGGTTEKSGSSGGAAGGVLLALVALGLGWRRRSVVVSG